MSQSDWQINSGHADQKERSIALPVGLEMISWPLASLIRTANAPSLCTHAYKVGHSSQFVSRKQDPCLGKLHSDDSKTCKMKIILMLIFDNCNTLRKRMGQIWYQLIRVKCSHNTDIP